MIRHRYGLMPPFKAAEIAELENMQRTITVRADLKIQRSKNNTRQMGEVYYDLYMENPGRYTP